MSLVVSFGLALCGKKAADNGGDTASSGDNVIRIAPASPLSGPQ